MPDICHTFVIVEGNAERGKKVSIKRMAKHWVLLFQQPVLEHIFQIELTADNEKKNT